MDLGTLGDAARLYTYNSEIDYSSFMVQQQLINMGQKVKSWEWYYKN